MIEKNVESTPKDSCDVDLGKVNQRVRCFFWVKGGDFITLDAVVVDPVHQ